MKNSKPKVLLVGAFHMGETPDMHKTELNNLLSPTRQQEIREVVEKLKEFNPTKVALEVVAEADEAINKQYKAYVEGQFQLPLNESYQLGFRIASELGHERMYPIDWMEQGAGTRPYGDVYDWAQTNQPELFNEVFGKDHSDLDKNSSILEMYKVCNDPVRIKESHELYINMARIGHVREYVGIDWLI